MVEDPKWELAILATVQGFYEKLLQDSIGGEVPVPAGLEAISLQEGDGEVHATLDKMRRWLRLLDQAITPAMLRRAFTTETDPEIAEAVLRYFTRKKDASDLNRDKTDLVATFLYRHPRVPGQWERRGYGLDGSLPLSPFEIALIEILADTDVPSLPEEHVQLLRRFDPLQEEAQNFSDLNALLDSEIIPRVRDLKQSLESSFYHPGVLATIAPYNAAFGRKFDEFFHAAATEIREFASALQEQGGTILGNVEGVDVTVEHVAALEEKRTSENRLQHRPGQVSPYLQTEAGAGTASADSPDVLFRIGSNSRRQPGPQPQKRPPARRGPQWMCWPCARRSHHNRFQPKRPRFARLRNRSGSSCAWPTRNSARWSPCVSSISR